MNAQGSTCQTGVQFPRLGQSFTRRDAVSPCLAGFYSALLGLRQSGVFGRRAASDAVLGGGSSSATTLGGDTDCQDM
jgi:hypothetical protein